MSDTPRNPWNLGDRIQSPVEKMVSLDLSEMDVGSAYKLLIGAVVPRPIAFVSTISPEGQVNLAPFSFFNAVSSHPPTVMISVSPKGNGTKKDTLRNIEATKQFVVNSVADWMTEPMNHTAADYPYGVSELEKIGLTAIPSVHVRPPRVKESPVHMECELYQMVPIGDGSPGSSIIVIGKILAMHIHDAAYRDGKILLHEISPISRLAGASYAKVTSTFDLVRPKI